jgi:hypothetical protein
MGPERVLDGRIDEERPVRAQSIETRLRLMLSWHKEYAKVAAEGSERQIKTDCPLCLLACLPACLIQGQ